MSYDDKIRSARDVIAQYNNSVGDEAAKIEADDFVDCFRRAGGVTEAALSACTWEDIENCKVPRLLARQIAAAFREKADNNEKVYIKPSKAKAMSNHDLLEAYDPTEPDSPIARELDARSKGQPFLIIVGQKVIVSASEDLLAELKLGLDPRDTFIWEGVPRPVYKVGDRPDNLVDINPLWTKENLRPNGDCVNINRSWSAVPLRTRQLIFLARENGELKIDDLRDAISVHTDALLDEGFNKIAGYAPQAHVELIALEESGNLPSMKRRLNPVAKTSASNDPFHRGEKHRRY